MSDVVLAKEPSAKYLSNVESLVRAFDLFSRAPNGSAKLRELILTLAAGGALGSNVVDAPTRSLGMVAEFVMGQAPPGNACNTDGRGTVFVKTGEFGPMYPVVREWTDKPLKYARRGDVLICVVGATIGKLNLAIDCAIGRSVAAIRPGRSLDVKYLYYMLMPYTLSLRRDSRGSAQGVIGRSELSVVPIRLPPLAEQHRIVSRVEELMKLCDALEQSGRLADEQHARLTSTLFGALAVSETSLELAENWQSIAEHFNLLLERPEAVDSLEQTILRLAVRGLLVMQDDREESAECFLERLRPAGLTSAGDVASRAEQNGIPKSWAWCAIEEIADVGTGTTPSRTNAAYFEPGEVPWVNSGETGQPFIWATAQRVSALALRETSLKLYPPGTLVVAMYGQGRTRGQVSELMISATTNQACAAIVPLDPTVHHRRYLKLVFEGSYDELRAEAAGGAQPNLNVGKVKSMRIPLPPLPEQRRIVECVDQIRSLCSELRERLLIARRIQSQLADALVAEVA